MEKFVTKLENEFDTILHHLSNTNVFRNIIYDIENDETVRTDHRLLLRYLKLNYLLITKGKSEHFRYDLKPDEIDKDSVHEIALFVFLNAGAAFEPDCAPLARLDVIEAVIDYSALTNTRHDPDRIESFLTAQLSENVRRTCRVVEKYTRTYPIRVGFFDAIERKVSPESLLEIACSGVLVPKSDAFWTDTVPALLLNGSFTEKKKAVYALRNATRSGALPGDSEAWRSFFTITEATSEKQFHLVQPTFKFVEALRALPVIINRERF